MVGLEIEDWRLEIEDWREESIKGGRLAVSLIGVMERTTVSSREKQRDSLNFKLMWSANRPRGSGKLPCTP